MKTKSSSLNNLFDKYSDTNKEEVEVNNNEYSDLLNMDKFKKPTMEDTHSRMTFLVDNDLKEEFNNLTKGKWGLKTKLINKALRNMLDEIKEEQL